MIAPGTKVHLFLNAAATAVCASVALVGAPRLSSAQAPAAAPAAFKGVFEPVNYSEDLGLTEVFFVTPETGWVAGAGGTILKTTDSGATWTAQLGGDPASQERAIKDLRFVSETVGWATQVVGDHTNLFQTRDGETWDQVGSIEEHYSDLAFLSETEGVFSFGKDIFLSHDGGHTWKKAYHCQVKAEIAGLSRMLQCNFTRLHFPSATTGYAVGQHSDGAMILKTTDAGAGWEVMKVMEDETGADPGLFFIDESTGFVSMHHSGRSFRTTDGGATWTGMPATSLSENIKFADPEVGWSFKAACVGAGCANAGLSYTTDGGRRWSSRSFALPAAVKAFSFPRRDVAYVVGDHGMIYRYRSVPNAAAVAPKAVAAIPMPPLANGVIQQVEKMDAGLDALEAAVAKAGNAPAPAAASANADTAWVETIAPEQFGAVEEIAGSVESGLPAIGRKHRNLNLVLQGLKLLGDLTGQGNGVRTAFASLRQARDVGSVSAALLTLHSELDAAKTNLEAFETGDTP